MIMKRLLLLATITILHYPAASQLNKGQWMVGGAGQYSSNQLDAEYSVGTAHSTSKQLEMSPGAGYFFATRLAAGLRLEIVSSNVSSNTGSSPVPGYIYNTDSYSKNSAIGFAPFVRYYFLKPDKKINLFADGSFKYTFNRARTRLYEYSQNGTNPPVLMESKSSTKFTAHAFALSAGPAFFINPSIALELTVGYSLGKNEDQRGNNETFLVGAGFNIHLGK